MTARKFKAPLKCFKSSRFKLSAAVVAASFSIGIVQATAGGLEVEVNQTRALHLNKPAAAVMVGNPAIADVTVLSPQLVYLLGRSYGQTNFVALDKSGKQISSFDVDVVAPSSSTVTLTRGAGQLTYNCTPRCERVAAQGDDTAAFSTTVQQIRATAGLAQGMANANRDQQAILSGGSNSSGENGE